MLLGGPPLPGRGSATWTSGNARPVQPQIDSFDPPQWLVLVLGVIYTHPMPLEDPASVQNTEYSSQDIFELSQTLLFVRESD
jgi:hypothetical protein